jgi:hypothetical protein
MNKVEVNGEEQDVQRKKVQQGKSAFFHRIRICAAKIMPLFLRATL